MAVLLKKPSSFHVVDEDLNAPIETVKNDWKNNPRGRYELLTPEKITCIPFVFLIEEATSQRGL